LAAAHTFSPGRFLLFFVVSSTQRLFVGITLQYFDGAYPAAFGMYTALQLFPGAHPAAFCRHTALLLNPTVHLAAFRRDGLPPTAFGRESLTALLLLRPLKRTARG
jgi:hypothetical protein